MVGGDVMLPVTCTAVTAVPFSCDRPRAVCQLWGLLQLPLQPSLAHLVLESACWALIWSMTSRSFLEFGLVTPTMLWSDSTIHDARASPAVAV